MSDELKKSIEKKRKIAEWVYMVSLFAVLYGACIIGIGVFQTIGVDNFINEDHMLNPSIPYNEKDNASFVITLNDIDELYMKNRDFVIAGAVMAGIGGAITIAVGMVTPNKKERHKLLCETPQNLGLRLIHYPVVEYCPSCGLKLSLLDKE